MAASLAIPLILVCRDRTDPLAYGRSHPAGKALGDVSPFGVSSAFWALLVGCATALVLERNDFNAYLAAETS